MVRYQISVQRTNQKEEVEELMKVIETNTAASFRNTYTALMSIALTIDDDGKPRSFDTVAAGLVRNSPYIDVLELVPDGVIKYVYPLKGNESVIGYDILADPNRNQEARRAIEERSIYFAGPLELKQGGLAVVGRLPVYRNNKFWGFSAAIIHFETLMKTSGLKSIDADRFNVSLSKVNPTTGKEEFFMGGQDQINPETGRSNVFPEGDWKLYIERKRDTTHIIYIILLCLFSVMVSMFIGYGVFIILKRPSEELSNVQKHLEVHLDNSPLGVMEYSQDLSIIKWSKRCEEIFGWTEQEILEKGMKALDLTYKNDLHISSNTATELMSGDVTGNISQNRNYTKNGSLVYCMWYNSAITNANGEVVSIMSLVEDITDQKWIESERSKSQERLELIFESTNDMLFLLEVEGDGIFRYSAVNASFLNHLGFNREQIIDKTGFDFISLEEAEKSRRNFEEVARSKTEMNYERTIKLPDRVLVVESTLKPILNGKGECTNILGVSRDITTRKRHENELQRSFDITKNQNQRLLNFAYIVSHNLRTHTSNISGILDMLEDSPSALQQAKLLNYLRTVSNTLDETMHHLNEVVNIHANVDIRIDTLNLKEYIEKTVDLLRERIKEKEARIRVDVNPELVVPFNTSYLESVLLNFISNALKYSHPDRTPLIRLKSKIENDFAVLTISDNGLGIDLDKHGDRLFGMYKRFHKVAEGKGLGLFITKNQIEAMNGRVEIESALGEGTTFRLYFKL